jgi:hypothetical protein
METQQRVGIEATPTRAFFQTTDTDLAAYLYTRAYPLADTCRVGRETLFIFPGEAALSAEAFYQGATVPAKNLLSAARRLDMIRRNARSEYPTA